MKKHLLAASLLMSAATSFGAGYQLNMQGLRQLAMGGTGTAWPWDASTIFYNPGGLARLKSIQVYASGQYILPTTAYGDQANSGNTGTYAVSKKRSFTPFNAYIGGPIQEDSRFALGLGIYSSAGYGISWDDNWTGRNLVQSVDFSSMCFQPTLSYNISEFLSVGAGFVYGIGTYDQRRSLGTHGTQGPNIDGSVEHLHGNATGAGFNAGVQMRINDQLQLGLTYRSQINMSVDAGTAIFSVPNSLNSQFKNTRFDTQLPIPQVASFGIGYRVAERLTLQLDVNYTGWESFDSLRINYAETSTWLQNRHEARNYRNTLTTRIGANYKISKIVSVMAGGAYDPTPVTNGFVTPELPDADRAVFSCGIALKPLRRFTILAAFEGMTSVKRNASYDAGKFSGVYQTQTATTGIGIYYNF